MQHAYMEGGIEIDLFYPSMDVLILYIISCPKGPYKKERCVAVLYYINKYKQAFHPREICVRQRRSEICMPIRYT
jgi:hypothetical protein